MAQMRIDRFFSEQEILSRSELKKEIKKGTVTVNGFALKDSALKIDTDSDEICYNGKLIEYQKHIYIMLNKPKGVVSSTDDKINKTVIDLVPPHLRRRGLFPAGRLDKDTVGFVLITNDGGFAHEMLSPKKHVEKTYVAVIDGSLTEKDIETLEKGAVLADGYVCKEAKLCILSDSCMPEVEIVLSEGKYHQIKRMFGVVGRGVIELKRTKIGGLELDKELAEGECREILHNELTRILGK